MVRKIDWDNQIGRRLTLHDLHVFFTVVQNGSMAKAAIHLGVSQPAVSEVIAGLERALDVRLLDRSRNGVEPTIYGRTLLKRGMIAFDALKQGIKDIQVLADPTAGDVRVGCSESLAASLLPPVVEQFCARNPRAVIHVSDALSATMELPELRARNLDIVIARLANPPVDPNDELEVQPLFDDVMIVAAGVQNPLSRRPTIKLAELVNEPWILPSLHSWNYMTVAGAFRDRGLDPPKVGLVTLSVHLRAHLLANGPYLTAFPKSVPELCPQRFPIKVLPIADLPLRPWPVVALTLKHRTLSPVVRLFLEQLLAVTRSMVAGPVEKKSA